MERLLAQKGNRVVAVTGWLTVGSGLAVIGCAFYCLLWFRPDRLTFLTPDIDILCWLYCSTLYTPFGVLAILFGALQAAGAILVLSGQLRWGGLLAAGSGLVNLPVGLPGLYLAYLVRK